MNHSQYAVTVLVESPRGIPLVRDPQKPSPLYWKLPGGRSEEGETAVQAAIREVKEEIGLAIEVKNIQSVHQENRNNHIFVFFRTKVSSLANLKKRGDEGEDVGIFTFEQISQMPDFFPPHLKVLNDQNII